MFDKDLLYTPESSCGARSNFLEVIKMAVNELEFLEMLLKDEKESKNGFGKQNKSAEFEHFCDLATREIELIADDENTAESLKESLGDFSRELRHIAKMNTNSSEQVWSQKIADVLIRLDSLLRSQGKDMLADALQHKLKSEFSKI